ncbi:MAG TPA: glycosyltransferase [Anaerolineae bacterium]|nr:glycosyltransferase [Anaerolineae bacterium]
MPFSQNGVSMEPRPRRYLFVVWDGGGTLPPELGLARRLVERGHQVHVLGDNPVEPDAIAAGCTFSGFVRGPNRKSRSPADDPFQDWTGSPIAAFKRVRDLLVCGPALEFAQDVLEQISKHRAEAVITDLMILGAVIGAEKADLPRVGIAPHCYMRPTPGSTPLGMGLHPAQGPLGRLRDAALRSVMTRMFAGGLPAIARARKELGLETVSHPFEVEDRLDRILVLSSLAFDHPQPALPENVRYVGPVLDDPIWAEPWTSPWSELDPRPLVLVSLGSTFQDQRAVVQRIVNALGGMEIRALVTLGSVFEPGEIASPDNVVTVRSAPHAQVLPGADLVITHGGHGTMMKSLAAGKPALCIPLGRDQIDNAVRLERVGAGLSLKPGASSDRIANAIQRLLGNHSYITKAQTFARQLEMGAGAAIVELEGIFGSREDRASRLLEPTARHRRHPSSMHSCP